MPSGTSSQCSSIQHEAEAMVITKVVANPILMAVSVFLEMPMNGHSPRNFTSTTLFTSTVLNNSNTYSRISISPALQGASAVPATAHANGGAQNQALDACAHQTSAEKPLSLSGRC